ncbi:Histone-lysine N-methyltransferase SETDB1 [Orchesella cincta]|uniref:Histone-lysine N-methyltransferase SETDB1 n=1 Tax=Orchesella cincta TaxID=48709 RepID=A0A1D2M1N8_ORCCI|nr:Histone-lysine N-methyltransferase SETDB1 [Orchesella cincta]
MGRNLLSCWREAVVITPAENKYEWVVRYNPDPKYRKPWLLPGRKKKGRDFSVRNLNWAQMAYNKPSPITLPVGTRIIAKLTGFTENDGQIYAGVVGDIPKPNNKNRTVTGASTTGELGPCVKKNGKWQIALVLEIDGIIARVRFENDMEITNVLRSSEIFANFINPVTKLNTIDPDLLPEYQGFIRKVKVPLNTSVLSPHECNSGCVDSYVPKTQLKHLSPLAIPLFFSWSRGVTKVDMVPNVVYGAPCGKAISSFKELIAYLKTTQSNFPQEFFSFDVDISVSDQFVPGRSLYKNDDASHGLEPIPIQVVNSIDKERLPEFEYIVESVLSQKLKCLKKNESDIQMCCKCVDNCKGKLKCACKKLNTNSKKQYSGYEDKLLEEYNPEALFECNSNCSCKRNCPTRVVQNGIIWPLQLFKSSKKGWGIRTLFDIPKGSYICSCSGEILCDDAYKRAARAHDSTYMTSLSQVPNEKEELVASTKRKKWATFSLPQTPNKDGFTVDATFKGHFKSSLM